MRLKKIRLAGFKSFVDATNIPFPGDMTAIVGPNGCGKSNVIDAVRWVLGESSAKNLRGDAMTDVIFNGSSARKPVGQCSVELVFDNSTGRIAGEYAKYNELSVKRVVTKEAISSYLLNGSKCRRKDITDLFLGTGLGPRSYAIIEQGMISRLIESKPQELRVFIEEAAGISKYKERRRETQNRISHTKDNLERLQDLRGELGEQLQKLKRQASAANKYKELKQKERTLKAQVATLRWMQQTDLLKASDKLIQRLREELNTLLASKQGDESGLQSLKNDLSMKKQMSNDLQSQIYALGTEITKLEQSQIFAKKRLGQIQLEKNQIKQSDERLALELSNIKTEVNELSAEIEKLEPEKFIFEQQLEEIEETKSELEQQAIFYERRFKDEDAHFFQSKQQLQDLHSKLQQTLVLQERTLERIHELEQEKAEMSAASEAPLAELENALIHAQSCKNEAQEALDSSKMNLSKAEKRQSEHRHHLLEAQTEQTKKRALLAAMSAQQQSDISSKQVPAWAKESELVSIWAYFSVNERYAKCLETILEFFDKVRVYTGQCPANNQLRGEEIHGLWLESQFVDHKCEGSLASLIEQEKVPWIFNYIFIAQDTISAPPIDAMTQDDTYVTMDGVLLSKGLLFSPLAQKESKVERASKMREVQADLYELEFKITEFEEFIEESEAYVNNARDSVDKHQIALELSLESYLTKKNEFKLQQLQLEQSKSRLAKLDIELEKYLVVMAQETESLEVINLQIEDLSIDVAEKEELRQARESEKFELNKRLQDTSAQYTSIQTLLHQQQMQLQQTRNSLQLIKEQEKSKLLIQASNTEKLTILHEEAETLSLPADDQQQKIQTLLTQKEKISTEQVEVNEAISKLDADIESLEKGQAGINAKIDDIKEKIESERLQGESARVRAQGFIEQLAQEKLSIRDILDELPEDADEKSYQTQLEQTSTSIQRLGAVNLAAVDEYAEQSERKAHLDAQDEDLTAALTTLEDAMRKIDKETKSRFKSTFDKVNDDLKSLFPKVFGGGSAYLDLTDDDLLDTGVTIMARPPGKKNSTIQLLSGGEKALTALSLVFAIFRLNPAPFCLLDEVDAPLDDANVGRFCNLVSEMSKSVQFIYITHNKVAMEMATDLTGVTMAEPGVSRLVAVNMEEALAIAE